MKSGKFVVGVCRRQRHLHLRPRLGGCVRVQRNGGPGTDGLQGPNGATTWNVTAANQGNIAGLVSSFNFTESLVGGTASDVFNVKAFTTGTPSVTGGGSPVSNTLNYDSEGRSVSDDTTPPDGIIDSTGVQSVVFSQIKTVNINNPVIISGRIPNQITSQ